MIKQGARFLFILYFTPPAPGTAPKRNYRILKYLSDRAERSFLFTAAYPGKPIPELKGIEVHPVIARDYRTMLRKRTADGYLPEQKKKAVWKQWGIKLINTFPFNILIGEGGLFYFNSILNKGNRLIREEGITHLYSSFRPFADHYVAYRLKKKNPSLLWIADFRDLIIDPHYKHNLLAQKQNSFFKKIFKTADVLTTVSEGLAKRLREYNSNVLVIRNGIDNNFQATPPVRSGYFTITYTGSMFLNTRNARPLFDAVKALSEKDHAVINNMRIEYAGKDSFYWNNLAREYHFENILVDHGLVADDEARRMQNQSCINLLLTISSPELQGVLTGKMVEYIEAGSPILGIVVGQHDPELSGILNELEIGLSFSDHQRDLKGIEDFIYGEYLLWKETGMNRKPVNMEELRRKYGMETTMAPLFV